MYNDAISRGRRAGLTPVVLALVLLVAGLGLSCYPGDELTISEADVVVTVFNSQVDFASLTTYALADSVVHLVPEGEDDDISRAYDAATLSTVKSNLDALGFTSVLDPATADVIVVVAVSASDYTSYYTYYPCYYYCWYYPYPPGWGWGYPPTAGSYSYRVGTVFINMALRNNPDPSDEHVAVAWVAALNGFADTGTNSARIKSGINQAFAQSKYLGAGK